MAGFDCILGNPPYLGGQALSGTYGYPFCEYVKWRCATAGLSDLVVYFVRRTYNLLRSNGFTSSSPQIRSKMGTFAKIGQHVLAQGGAINFAVRAIKWPGRANVVVSLVAIHKGDWSGKRVLDERSVQVISPYFEDHFDLGPAQFLSQNADRVYQGSILLGNGFMLTHQEAEAMRSRNPSLDEVLFPLINGQELNSSPDQSPGRHAINFFNWSQEEAERYGEAFDRVVELVKPEREKVNRTAHQERWWQYAEKATGLYDRNRHLNRCFVAAATTKHLNFSALPTNYVFTHALYVFTTDRWDLYPSSSLRPSHEVWARKYSGALETRLRYSPSDCFETFPFPEFIWQVANPALADIGERYHEHRRALMRQLWIGLTDIYNLFHTRDLAPRDGCQSQQESH